MDGWFLGSSQEHYRAFVVWIKKTGAKRVTDTVAFQHKSITGPAVTHGDAIVKAARDLITALKRKPGAKGDEQMRDLKRLGQVFGEVAADKTGAEEAATGEVANKPLQGQAEERKLPRFLPQGTGVPFGGRAAAQPSLPEQNEMQGVEGQGR